MVYPILDASQTSGEMTVENTQRVISNFVPVDRFQSFLDAARGDIEVAERLYIWNIKASGALWGSFHLLEVILRNKVHEKFKSTASIEEWWDSPAIALHQNDRDLLEKAIGKAGKQHAGRTVGHVVAELNFGFWVALFAKNYHNALWVNNLESLFPNYSGRRNELHADLDSLRKLRNRIAHHEPIHNRNLLIDYGNMCAIISYMDSDLASLTRSLSRVIDVVNSKEAMLLGQIQASF